MIGGCRRGWSREEGRRQTPEKGSILHFKYTLDGTFYMINERISQRPNLIIFVSRKAIRKALTITLKIVNFQ